MNKKQKSKISIQEICKFYAEIIAYNDISEENKIMTQMKPNVIDSIQN